ncbi:hypothetical protein GNI_144510 [Gregarina niphandrodes]|uniref:Uncharacterized protein n=1 Tax=Gregarina niphandrodes TaxID=110365 RepID=A0A023B0C7_GRENI|nr:hypothetical protein GNI_144510 [Gregarina niphandrodes]EZG44715.1 hypothetical protein GNI_144510 [Gregarina niphandrodes]|eukprot:XP_011134135.1 hypothetical protein GNI_144510 [Gregarina niphandrodes]
MALVVGVPLSGREQLLFPRAFFDLHQARGYLVAGRSFEQGAAALAGAEKKSVRLAVQGEEVLVYADPSGTEPLLRLPYRYLVHSWRDTDFAEMTI